MFRIPFSKVFSLLFATLLLCHSPLAWGQEGDGAFTLEQCIQEAKAKSLSIGQAKLQEKSARSTLTRQWGSLAPTVSAGASHSFTFGRAIDYGDNTISNNLQSTNLSIGADLTLFTGLQRLFAIQASRLALEEQQARMRKAEQELTLKVVQTFLDMLYQGALCESRKISRAVAQEQVELAGKRAAAGAIAQGAVLDLESQLATEEQLLIEAQNALEGSRVLLAQLIRYEGEDTLRIVAPAIDSGELLPPPAYTIQSLYEEASGVYPALQAADLSYQQADRSVKMAGGRFSPTLSLSVNFGTGARQFLDPNRRDLQNSYLQQFKDNASEQILLSLRVPIFSGLSTLDQLQQAKIARAQRAISIESVEQELYNLLQRAWADAQASYRQYLATSRSVEALQESTRWAEQKHAIGAISSYEYTQARSKLLLAEAQLLHSRYQYLFKLKLLDLYRGLPVEL